MSINEKLNSVLEDGESIRWSGTPQPYSLFDESRKTSTIITFCVALAVAVILSGGYYASTVSSGTEMKFGVILFLLGIALLFIWGPISDKGKVKKLQYAITDKKVISMSNDDDNPVILPLADIDNVRVDKGDNGNVNVRVGSSVFKASPKKLPILAYRGEYDEHDGGKKYKGLVLFNVGPEDGKTIGSILTPALPSAKK